MPNVFKPSKFSEAIRWYFMVPEYSWSDAFHKRPLPITEDNVVRAWRQPGGWMFARGVMVEYKTKKFDGLVLINHFPANFPKDRIEEHNILAFFRGRFPILMEMLKNSLYLIWGLSLLVEWLVFKAILIPVLRPHLSPQTFTNIFWIITGLVSTITILYFFNRRIRRVRRAEVYSFLKFELVILMIAVGNMLLTMPKFAPPQTPAKAEMSSQSQLSTHF
jgi:hypothetical protein